MPYSDPTCAPKYPRIFVAALLGVSLFAAAVQAAESEPTHVAAPKWSPSSNRYIERNFADFGPFEMTTLTQESSALNLFLSSAKLDVERDVVEKWVHDAAAALSAFYGHFPVPKVTIVLLARGQQGISGGMTFSGHLIRMRFGPRTDKEEFACDWTMTHEMFHLAFPDLDDKHLWMEEGMAVYFEPLARARVGNLSDEEVWKGMLHGMQNGLPQSGDEGLDRTHTWGRTYWGGALFWFTADLEIRKQTNNKHSADDALRAILDHDGDGSTHWEMAGVLAAADKATETHVISDLYAKCATQPVSTDLGALWKSLGVTVHGRRVTFDDAAPLAAIRKSLTDPKQNSKK